jgi:hypothetical protein
MGMERRGCIDRLYWMVNQEWEEPLDRARPFGIAKRVVWEAFKRVKANQGAAGVDGESIAEFERDLTNNPYKLWNRMSSGSYFPPPVRTVEIPKSDGGKRALGIPTVSDRVAQMVVKMYPEPMVEPHSHQDSYGYRPGRSATQAVGVARQRCWRIDWVRDLDIKGFFDIQQPSLFSHGNWPHTLWPVDRSRMNREVHVRICEGVGVKLPRATRPMMQRRSLSALSVGAILDSKPF